MGELQCFLEFSLELHKFINVDLFQRGFYQVRSTLKAANKLPVKVEVNLPKNSTCSLVFPACIINGTAVSKTFQILFKNEEVILDDVIIFKVHTVLEGHKVHETLLKADFQIILELWFTDQSFGHDQHNSIHCVSTRTLLLHFDPARGLHHHVPLLFDYFHLCAVTLTVHASLISLCQPYLRKGVMATHHLSMMKLSKQPFLNGSPCLSSKKSHSSLETVLFGSQVGRSGFNADKLCRARIVHWEVCSILLSAYYSLCQKSIEFMSLLPVWMNLKLESIEKSPYLDDLSEFAKECYNQIRSDPNSVSKNKVFGSYKGMNSEDEFLLTASSDIANLCCALILLWEKFLERVIGKEKVHQHLSRQRHLQRVKRFSEAFFIIERTRDSALAPCDSSVEAYTEVSDSLRKSSYLNLLPPLEVECIEFDGDLNSLPIFYEEHYQEATRRGSNNSHSSQSESNASLTDNNFSIEECADDNDALRRNSQGSLGQKYRAPDISATPTSPSAFSWCPDSVISSPSSLKHYIPSKKGVLKDKIFHNICSDVIGDEYCVSSSAFTKINHKIAVRSKLKLRSRTVNFLRQLKKPPSNQGPNSTVILLGVKKLESCCISNGVSKASRVPFTLESGIRHSQSTLSVMSALYTEDNSIPNSESMPDLTTGFVPLPPPPPPIQKSQRAEASQLRSNLLTVAQDSLVPRFPIDKSASLSQVAQISLACNNFDVINMSEVSFKKSVVQKGHSKKCALDIKKELSDDMFDASSSAKSDSGLSAKPIVSSQSSKHKKEYIFDGDAMKSKKNEPPPPLSFASEDFSNNDSNVPEICPPSPPVQFKDPPRIHKKSTMPVIKEKSLKPHKKKNLSTIKSSTWSNESCLTSIICQGTLFFPRPPAEFGDDITEPSEQENDSAAPEKKDSETNQELLNSMDEYVGNGSLDVNDSTKIQEEAQESDSKSSVLELLADISESQYISNAVNGTLVDSSTMPESLKNAPDSKASNEETPSASRMSLTGSEMISFVKAKEEFRKHLQYPWLWYSDFPSLASEVPYFQCDSDLRAFSPEGMHLVICVHGLDGNSADFRLVKTYLELGLPTVNFEFLMSERNQGETFDDFDTMTDRLVSEISYYIEVYGLKPTKISFIGHSLGNIIIRAAIARSEMEPYLTKLHTFLSLSGPHLGTLYNNSGLVNMGMWFVQKWKKSGSLLQLAMKDSSNLRQTFLYKLSQKSSLVHFRNILLFGSSQDRYVPLHSARIELCKPALKDTSLQGIVYREMVTNLMQPVIQNPNVSLLRYDVHHALPTSANSLIGRAAHVAVLDSELFIEKFLTVCGLQFFA